MNTANVEVQFVDPPKGNAKTGSIKGADGTYYRVPPAMLALVQPNGVYTVSYEDNEFQGKTYHMVRSIKPAANPAAQAAAMPQPPRSQVTVQRAQTNAVDAQRIFICGAINAALHGQGLGAIAATELSAAIDALELVWRSKKSLGREATAIEGDLDDEVPFNL